jgi:Zn-dependent peptidase ImmA (M78 family)
MDHEGDFFRSDWDDAILEGAKEAGRLHEQLELKKELEGTPGSIDVFRAIIRLNIPLLFRPLEGLLGAYLTTPSVGIVVTSQRPLSIQRFTGAHELGHAYMRHKVSLDDNSILQRTAVREKQFDYREVAADSFGATFLMPRWLMEVHAGRQHWNAKGMKQPFAAYQMALRLGTSYDATCRSLERNGIIDRSERDRLLDVEPRDIKKEILQGRELEDWYSDVWVLSEADEGTRIQGNPRDVFVLKLRERSGAGYLWNIKELSEAGFAILGDSRKVPPATKQVGGPVDRVVTARQPEGAEGQFGHVTVRQLKPWSKDEQTASRLSFTYELFGKEAGGLARAERTWEVAA